MLSIATDTNFCFTIPQSKVIAKYLVKGQFADSLEKNYEGLVLLNSKQQQVQDSLQLSFETKINKLNEVVYIKDRQIDLLDATLKDRERRIKRAKWQKGALGTISTILTGILIFK